MIGCQSRSSLPTKLMKTILIAMGFQIEQIIPETWNTLHSGDGQCVGCSGDASICLCARLVGWNNFGHVKGGGVFDISLGASDCLSASRDAGGVATCENMWICVAHMLSIALMFGRHLFFFE